MCVHANKHSNSNSNCEEAMAVIERRLVHISVNKLGLLAGIGAALFSLIGVCAGLIAYMKMQSFMSANMSGSFGPSPFKFTIGFHPVMMLLAPVLYFVVGYIVGAVYALLFNLIAPRIDGIPVQFVDRADDGTPA